MLDNNIINIIDKNDFIYIKQIGKGGNGEIYKVKNKNNNKYYALKFEKIIDDDLTDRNSRINREINFYNNFGNKYTNFFTKYYGYYLERKNMLINSDKLDIQINIDQYDNIIKEYIIKHKKSNLYMSKIYDLVDISLDKIINKLNKEELYSMIIQVTNIINLLHSNKYIHGDFHYGNIGILYTKKKYIRINNINVPTYGYIYKLIDLSFVMNKNDICSKYDEYLFNNIYYKEYINLLNYLIEPNKNIHCNNHICKYWSCIQNNKNLKSINDEYINLVKNNKIIDKYDNKYINLYVYYLNVYKKKIKKNDIIFILNNINKDNINYSNIILYFSNKINNKHHYNNFIILYIIVFTIIFMILNKI